MADGQLTIKAVLDASGVTSNAKKVESALDGVADSADDAASTSSKGYESMRGSSERASSAAEGLKSSVGGVASKVAGVGGAVAGAGTALVAFAGSQQEAISQTKSLETAFQNAGGTVEQAHATYDSFYRLLGESDRSTEAAQNLARLTTNQQDLQTWTNISAGAFAAFGDALPIENLTEAANETANTGTVVGGLADALNWSTASSGQFSAAMSGHASAQAAFNSAIQGGATKEDAFNAALQACNDEQERGQLITDTLNGLYGEMGVKYQETNADTLAARDSQNQFNQKLQELAEALQPIASDIIDFATSALGAVKDGLDWVIQNKDLVVTALTAIGTGFAVFKVATLIQSVVTALNAFRTATTLAQAAQVLFNNVLRANPIILVVSLIASLVAALVTFFTQTETGRQLWQQFTSFLGSALQAAGDVIKAVWDAIVGFFRGAWETIKGIWSAVTGFFKGVWNGIKNVFSVVGSVLKSYFQTAWNNVKSVWSAVTGFFRNIWNGIKNAFSSVGSTLGGFFRSAWNTVKGVWDKAVGVFRTIKDGIVGVFKGIGDTISKPFRAAFDGIKNMWNSTIGGFGFTVPSWVPGVGGREFRLPYLASGGLAKAATVAMIGEGAHDEAVLPLSAPVYSRIGEGIAENSGGGNVETLLMAAISLLQEIRDKDPDVYMDGQKVSAQLSAKARSVSVGRGVAWQM